MMGGIHFSLYYSLLDPQSLGECLAYYVMLTYLRSEGTIKYWMHACMNKQILSY